MREAELLIAERDGLYTAEAGKLRAQWQSRVAARLSAGRAVTE